VIDASQMGNIARFFNHSCNPNMATYSVFIDTDDSYRHELAFFTTRAIQAGEELTFDYGGFKGGSRPKSASGNNGLEPCRCGAANCRGTLPLTV
jgi:SET domain-containing protein